MKQNNVYITIYTHLYEGFCKICNDDGTYIINSLDVLSKYRRQGYGTCLIKESEDIIKKLGGDCSYLYVSEKDTWVHEWYKRLGYNDIIGEYEKGFIKMRKEL